MAKNADGVLRGAVTVHSRIDEAGTGAYVEKPAADKRHARDLYSKFGPRRLTDNPALAGSRQKLNLRR